MAYQWYVLRSKPNKEEFLARQIELHGVEVYLPFLRIKPVNPRAKTLRPYFPGYLFVHLDLGSSQSAILERLPGSVNLVNFGGEIPFVPDPIVAAIRQKVDQACLSVPKKTSTFSPGDAVRITGGLLEGYEGILDTSLPGSERVRVLLKLLQNKNVRVDLPVEQIEKKKPK